MLERFPADALTPFKCPEAAYGRLVELYDASISVLRRAFTQGGCRTVRVVYPYVGMRIEQENLFNESAWSHGFVTETGSYGSTITQPFLFREYLIEQMSLLMERHKVPLYIGHSRLPVPLPFALQSFKGAADIDLWRHDFDWPNLYQINDDVPNGVAVCRDSIKPLALFEADRVDYSLHRLQHYTGTQPSSFQKFILLTNYQRYIDAFVEFGKQGVASAEYESLTGPGDVDLCNPVAASHACLPQMPAYHLVRGDGYGMTCINIGVGPSNAKTITDHVAVLRPHCWIMLGHCAGLRSTQTLGDYVMAHGYVREDNVLNHDLPPWIPIPPIAEVQVALQEAVAAVSLDHVKERMRTGTVVTTDNRNWELRSKDLYKRFCQSRAIAVDMESATLAGNGFRFRVPYGTLLCVSDKPIHGDIKLRGTANVFYRKNIQQHLHVGIAALGLLYKRGTDQLHSRKLRGLDDPPFR